MPSDKLSKLKKAVEKKKAAAKAGGKVVMTPVQKPRQQEPKPQEEYSVKPKLPITRSNRSAKEDLGIKIVRVVMTDPRLGNFDEVAKILVAVTGRKDEIENKTKTLKTVLDEEVKKLGKN